VFHVGAPRAPAAAGAGAGATDDSGSFPTLILVLIGVGAVATLALARLLGRVAALAGALAVTALVVVVALTASTDTGATAETGAAKPFRADIKLGTLDSKLAILPARVGWNRIELELPPPTGTEGGYFEVRVWASLQSAGRGPMHFAGIQGTELNSFAVRRAYLPLPGSWRLRVSARRGVSGRYVTTLIVPVPAR
jgi:hypothetical protein